MENTDYVIIKEDGEPLRFTDGDIVLYNDYEEAREDKLPNEKIIPFSKLYNKSLDNLGDYAG